MARIQPVLNSGRVAQKEDLSLQTINRWVSDLREMPYGYSMQWRTPAEVAHDSLADCKGKAVALYGRMREHGAHNLRLVIGKRAPTSRVTHVWLEWGERSRTYVLDPTCQRSVCYGSYIQSSSYVGYYAYDGAHRYRAPSIGNLYAKL